MRCKNWVNGIEIVFHVGGTNNEIVEGMIQYVPQEIFENIPATVDFVLYLYKVWRSAMYTFKRVYFKKNNRRRNESGGMTFPALERANAVCGRVSDSPRMTAGLRFSGR
jgi:hypothetical protein